MSLHTNLGEIYESMGNLDKALEHGHLRKAVRRMNQILADLKLKKAPDKTYIGRIKKGFDFLGYRFGDIPRGEIKIANSTWQNHFNKLTQRVKHKFNEVDLLDYIKRWWRWVRLGVGDFEICKT